MTAGRARRALGIGLLAPALLLVLPSSLFADTRPAKKAAAKEPTAKDRRSTTSASTAAARACVHVVRKGETIGRIAQQHHVTQKSLIATNRLQSPNSLRVGQRLTLPRCQGARPRPGVAAADAANRAQLTARVGPRRVPTRLHLAMPAFAGEIPAFEWPVDGPVLSGFGKRRAGWHAGVDIRADSGTAIVAAAPGTVVFSGWAASYGQMIKIEHDGGFVTIYAHNLENSVATGDVVEAGTVIGSVGRSGRATASHLHFEIRRERMAYNPIHLLTPRDLMLARNTGAVEAVPVVTEPPARPGPDEDSE